MFGFGPRPDQNQRTGSEMPDYTPSGPNGPWNHGPRGPKSWNQGPPTNGWWNQGPPSNGPCNQRESQNPWENQGSPPFWGRFWGGPRMNQGDFQRGPEKGHFGPSNNFSGFGPDSPNARFDKNRMERDWSQGREGFRPPRGYPGRCPFRNRFSPHKKYEYDGDNMFGAEF